MLTRNAVAKNSIAARSPHTSDGANRLRLGGAVAESLLEAGVVPRAFHRIGLRQGFSSIVGSQDYLRTRYGLDAPAIIEAVRRVVESRTATR